jgi:hypothetical protein
MFNLLTPFLSGFICTLFLFLLCFVIVIGIKAIFLYALSLLPKRKEQPAPPPVQEKPKKEPKKSKQFRSIQINPDDFDRIYVKKS